MSANLRQILSLPKYIKGEEIKSPKELRKGDMVFIFDSLGKSQFDEDNLPSLVYCKREGEGRFEVKFTFFSSAPIPPFTKYFITYFSNNNEWHTSRLSMSTGKQETQRIVYKAISLD